MKFKRGDVLEGTETYRSVVLELVDRIPESCVCAPRRGKPGYLVYYSCFRQTSPPYPMPDEVISMDEQESLGGPWHDGANCAWLTEEDVIRMQLQELK